MPVDPRIVEKKVQTFLKGIAERQVTRFNPKHIEIVRDYYAN